MDYFQPDFYRFGEDSLFLVHSFFRDYSSQKETLIDIGTGCGVIAIEIASKAPELDIDCLEFQNEFKPFFEKNLTLYPLEKEPRYISKTLGEYASSKANYDWIVSNPPYFDPKNSRLSPDQKRSMARAFIKESMEDWAKGLNSLFHENSRGLILVRNEEFKEILSQLFRIKRVEKAPGAQLLFITRLNKD